MKFGYETVQDVYLLRPEVYCPEVKAPESASLRDAPQEVIWELGFEPHLVDGFHCLYNSS